MESLQALCFGPQGCCSTKMLEVKNMKYAFRARSLTPQNIKRAMLCFSEKSGTTFAFQLTCQTTSVIWLYNILSLPGLFNQNLRSLILFEKSFVGMGESPHRKTGYPSQPSKMYLKKTKNIAKGNTNPCVDCFNQITNLKNYATAFPRHNNSSHGKSNFQKPWKSVRTNPFWFFLFWWVWFGFVCLIWWVSVWFLSPSGDLGIGLVWDNNRTPPHPTATFRSDCWNPLQRELNYLWLVLICSQDDFRRF